MRKHRAKWHDTCRLEYNQTKLCRAEKRTQEDCPVESDSDSEDADPELEPPTKFTRLSLGGHIIIVR